jgi:act minimal PKS chain-length factor (CLF/KS beta)
MALDLARSAIEQGDADVCLVAGGDAPFNLMTVSTLLALGVLDRRDLPHLGLHDPANAGMILGEGGVALVLERTEAVAARGGRAYAIPGPLWMVSGEGDGQGPTTDRAALDHVLARAFTDVAPDLVFAEGGGIPAVDRLEAAAIQAAAPGVRVDSAKPQVGAWPGAGFLLEAAHAALAISAGDWQAGGVGCAAVVGVDLSGSVAAMSLIVPPWLGRDTL